MDRHNADSAGRFVERLAAAARADVPPSLDVTAGVLTALRARRRETVPVWDWSFTAVALASCAVALLTMVASAEAFGFLFDPLVDLLSGYPDMLF